MTLTVPRASSNPGSVAQVRVEPNTNAAAVGVLGNRMQQLGQQLESEALNREAQRFQIDVTKDLNDLRLEVSQEADPETAGQMWDQGSAAIKEKYKTGTNEAGRPLVRPKNADRFDLTFDELNNSHSFGLGKQFIGQRHAQNEANYIEYAHTATQQARTADAGTRETLISQGHQMIDGMVESGVIDPAEAARRKIGLVADFDNAQAIELVASDPELFLEQEEAGAFNGLPGERVARLRVQAQNKIDAETARQERVAVAVVKQRGAAIGDRLGELRNIYDDDRRPVDDGFMDNADVQAHPDYAETRAALELSEERPDLKLQTPTELRAMLEAEKAEPADRDFQTERQAFLEKTLAAAEEGWSKDPIAFASAVGFEPPELPEFDPANPDAYGTALRQRVAFGEALAEQGYVTSPDPWTNAERDVLADQANADQDPAARMSLVKALTDGFGIDARSHAENLSGDPVFSWTTSLVTQGAPDKTARDILAGQTKLDQKTATSVPRNVAVEAFHALTDGIFADQDLLTNAVMGSALAIYAQENPSADPAQLDEDRFDRAIRRAMGGSAGGNEALGRGGLQTFEINDGLLRDTEYQLPVPANLEKRQIDVALQSVSQSLDRRAMMADPDNPSDLVPTAQPSNVDLLTSASLTGAGPDFGGEDVPGFEKAKIWNQLQMAPLWPDGEPTDRYVFFRMRNGRPVYLQDDNGRAFQFSLNRLVQGAQQ